MNFPAIANQQSAQAHRHYHIRPMQEKDIDAVMTIDRASFSLPWSANAYHYELNENPRSLLWIAETFHRGSMLPDSAPLVIGMIVVWMILDEAHIATIAVHPDFRGMGIGRSMLIVALREAIRQGATLATLEVRASNLTAQNLYRSFQFQTVGERHHYYLDNNEDALIMSIQHLGKEYLEWLNQPERMRKTLSDGGA